MVLRIAHRGASGYEPENTLLSIKKAMELDADIIELDVHRCKTGEIVVVHDNDLKRTTDGKGKVKDLTLQQIKRLNGRKGEKIPLLSEVLDLMDKNTILNIELKGKDTATGVAELIKEKVLEKNFSYDNFMVCSFRIKELKKFHQLMPEIKLGLLLGRRLGNFLKTAKELKAYSVNLFFLTVNKRIVQKIHQEGLKLFVYTANKPKDIQKMEKLGVDGIISDFLDRI